MKTDTKHEDIISKSVLVQSGSPTRYQLTPKKEMTGRLRRLTVGEKDPHKTNKTILLVGETGSGKSSLVNSLVNFAMGVTWEDDVWFQIVEDEQRRQTSDVTVYQIFGFEGKTLPHSLSIIDTPGYGDTRGSEQDAAISQRLFDLFFSEDGVHEINAVGLVLKATENRLSDRLRYVFDSVLSLLGKDVEKNVVVLITHSDGRRPKNALKALEDAKIKCAKDENNQPVYFLYNVCQDEDRTEDAEGLQQAERVTAKGMSQFQVFLEKTPPLKLKTTVWNEQLQLLHDCIHKLQGEIVKIELKQREILQNQDKERTTVSGGRVTFCSICQENCHYPGKVSSGPGHCEVMKDGHCTVCTRKCPESDHKLIRAENEQSLLENPEKKMEELQKEKDQLLEESFEQVVKLERISLITNSLSTYVHLDFLIEKMKERGDLEKVQKLGEMKSRVDERIRAGLQNVFSKLKAAVKQAKI